jgi:hypothetical protein
MGKESVKAKPSRLHRHHESKANRNREGDAPKVTKKSLHMKQFKISKI